MKAESKPQARAAAKAGGFMGLRWSTILAAVAAGGLLMLAANMARTWLAARETLGELEADLANLTARNLVLERAAAVLKNDKFQVCNKTADTLTIPWISAAFHDGRQLRQFDSSRCHGWRPQVLGPGDLKAFTFSSAEEGCNWNGAVMLYAFTFVRESEEYVRSYNVAGQWAGFERCFTVE